MTARRIIPCLDVKDGRVVKGRRFVGLADCGLPAELAARYESEGADELVMLDISAGPEGRRTALETVRSVRAALSIPLCVGGGVRTLGDVEALLSAGADKVAINSQAYRKPELIDLVAGEFGSQCCVVAVDACTAGVAGWRVVLDSGMTVCDRVPADWIHEAAARGAGEIMLTSRDRDGTGEGYDLALLAASVEAAGRVPVVASGGASTVLHLEQALGAGVSAVLLAGVLHRRELDIETIKAYLNSRNIGVRI